MFSKMKMPLLIAALFLLFGCSPKESEKKTPILIEGVVISETGHLKHKEVIDQFMAEKTTEIMKISSIFSGYLTGTITVDNDSTSKINSTTVPAMSLNGKLINRDHSLPEKLSSEVPGSVATIFVKSGNEFVRISTSLKKSSTGSAAQATTDEERAVGSTLSHAHPAYNACLAGNSYTGTATLFGSIYMAEYTPIKNAAGAVIGIRFVGMDISGDLILLKRKIQT